MTKKQAPEIKKRGRPRKIAADKLEEPEKPKKSVEKKNARQIHRPEEITVFYPEQLFGPVPYNSFRCGNLFYKTFTQPNETIEEAYERAWKFLSARVEEQYAEVKKDFWRRYESMAL